MLTSRITQKLDIPNEPGQYVTIRKLSYHQLMMSADAKVDAALSKAQKLGEVKLPESSPEDKAKQTVEAQKPENRYDLLTVLRYGVTEWSYDLPPEAGVEDLDEQTAEWLFGEIIAFSVRSASEVKVSANGSQPSTDQAEAVGPTS